MVSRILRVDFSCSLNLPKLSCASVHFSIRQEHVTEYILRHGEAAAPKVLRFATVLFEKFIQKTKGSVVTMLFKFSSIL